MKFTNVISYISRGFCSNKKNVSVSTFPNSQTDVRKRLNTGSYRTIKHSFDDTVDVRREEQIAELPIDEVRYIQDEVIKEKLKDACWENTKPFIPRLQFGKVIKVYDGDTITVVGEAFLNAGLGLYRFQIRIAEIDAPEMRTKDEDEKTVAKLAQKDLEKWILGKHVFIDGLCLDKYGRLLAYVYFEGRSVGDWLLERHYAVPYNGRGKEHLPKNWLTYYNTK